MFHTLAYSDSTSSSQTDTDIPLVTDPSVTVLNSHPVFPVPIKLIWLYGLGLTMTRLRVSTPRLKPILRPVIQPVDQNATPTENYRCPEYWRRPLPLNAVEEVQVLRTNTTAVAERDFAIMTVGDGVMNVPQGDCYSGRFTTTFTPTVATWTSGAVTADDTLQVGRYSIIGMRVNNASGVAARLIFPGTPIQGAPPQIRPGTIVAQSNASEHFYWQRYGLMGELGQFESFALPQLDMMVAAATANPEVFLDIVNVRVGARGAT